MKMRTRQLKIIPGAAYLCGLLIFFAFPSILLAKEARVEVDLDAVSDWRVDRMLFGRFYEHHGCDVYPGIYEQYIVNTSLEKYYHKGEDSPTPLKDVKSWLVFEDIPATEGVAYPWQPYNGGKDVAYALSPDAFNSKVSQQIKRQKAGGGDAVGIKQKLALPDYRTGKYHVELYAKARNPGQKITVQLEDRQNNWGSAGITFELSDQWNSYSGMLKMGDYRTSSRHADRHGIYDLVVCFAGGGEVYLDQMTLFPDDAVEGVWHPETIKHLQEAMITVIRWPGGNFASGYHWQDGVGPVEKRPTRPNWAWAGLESNHVGTDEFLHYCDLVGMTPLICVAFDTCTPQEAANWVEYCNGDKNTKYGRLRARYGHPEPYNVRLWQVGNEVYGSYQMGHTNAEDYASRYLDYYQAMKKVDPDISMMTMGRDPGYHTDDDNAWNKTLFRIIGEKMDYLDIHRYVRGFRRWNELQSWDLTHLAEIYLSYPSQYDVIVNSIRDIAEKRNLHDVKLAVTEWAQYLSLSPPQLPHPFSQANAVFYAGMMNCFLRHGDFVRISCSHDFSVFKTNKEPWNIPVLPRSHIARLYAEVDTDRLVDIEVECDTYDLKRKITQMMTLDDIPYLDVVALTNDEKSTVCLFIVNRSLTADYDVEVRLDGPAGMRRGEALYFTAKDDPMAAQTWTNPRVFQWDRKPVLVRDGRFEVTSPLCSVTRVILKN